MRKRSNADTEPQREPAVVGIRQGMAARMDFRGLSEQPGKPGLVARTGTLPVIRGA